jgi:hypothetical protein
MDFRATTYSFFEAMKGLGRFKNREYSDNEKILYQLHKVHSKNPLTPMITVCHTQTTNPKSQIRQLNPSKTDQDFNINPVQPKL